MRTQTATIEIPATLAEQTAQSLRAVGRDQTLAEFIENMLADFLEADSGFWPGMIEPEDEPRRAEIEAELARIRTGSADVQQPADDPLASFFGIRIPSPLREKIRAAASLERRTESSFARFYLDRAAAEVLNRQPDSQTVTP